MGKPFQNLLKRAKNSGRDFTRSRHRLKEKKFETRYMGGMIVGRRRVQVDIDQELLIAKTQQRFDFTDDDGLYPFSSAFKWRPQKGKAQGTLVSLTIDAEAATKMELKSKSYNSARFFYSEFKEQYPWAVRSLGRGLKTLCLSRRVSHSEGSYARNSISVFLEFCRREGVELNSFEDLNFQLLCSWRSELRLDNRKSSYKAALFRRFCKVLELLMGTSEYPVRFSVPVMRFDTSEPLPPYSDAVMYQLIAAAATDVDNIIAGAAEFEKLALGISNSHAPRRVVKKYDWKEIVSDFMQGGCNIRNAVENSISPDDKSRKKLTLKSLYMFKQCPDEFQEFFEKVSLVARQKNGELAALRRLDEKQIPSRDSLFPFFLFFLINSGANKETACSWKRRYKIGSNYISPLDWKDPFDDSRCRLRGIKYRGKSNLHIGVEDTWIQIAEEGMYPMLKFLLWYTEPVSKLADFELRDHLWLYMENNKKGVYDYDEHDSFGVASQSFLNRHEIWDVQFDDDGGLLKARVTSLDSRRFRKVFTAKELLKTIKESQNFQELASQLQSAMHHANFDTTLASYMSIGKSKDILDIGIFTLQTQMVEEARKFRGVRVEYSDLSGRAGLYTACADPTHPDHEWAIIETGSECGEYDMCLGCSQSRVFSVHLPRIAMRILQYEVFKKSMPIEYWDAEFGRKAARAYDVLSGWSNKKEVELAWQQAREGTIFLPEIIVRG